MTSKFLAAALIAFAVLAKGVYAEEAKAAAKPAEKKAEAKKEEKKEEKKDDKKAGADAEVLKTDTKTLLDAFKAKDIDKVLSHYSEKFTSPKLQDKAAVKALLDMAINSGYFDNMSVEDKDSKITIDGENATIGPVLMNGSFGTATNTFHATQEIGKWLITGQDLEGVEI